MKVNFITEPNRTGGIYRYTTDLIKAIGNRAETSIEEYREQDLVPEFYHLQHGWGYIHDPPRNIDEYKVITLHDVPLWPHDQWYARVKPHIIVGNEMMERELLRIGVERDKLTVIPHGATIWEPSTKDYAREKLGLDVPYKNIIIQPGFIAWGKGMSEVIYAVSKIPDTYLVFAGGVNAKADYRDKKYLLQCMKGAKSIGMENRVHFVGSFLSESELELWMSAADILILNHQFVYGSYSASAMAKRMLCAERPIIMSHDVRLSEYKDGEQCLKVVAEDINQVEATIRKLIDNPKLGEQLSDNAKRYADRYSWYNMATRHLTLYEKINNDASKSS